MGGYAHLLGGSLPRPPQRFLTISAPSALCLPPPVQDDLVCLPSKVCKENGNVGPVLLCIRVTAALLFMDPTTLRTYQVGAPKPSKP